LVKTCLEASNVSSREPSRTVEWKQSLVVRGFLRGEPTVLSFL
jgi:hypothetical protein